jgi:hypothetical protein
VLGATALAVALFFVVRAGGDDDGDGQATVAEPTTVEETTTASETEDEETTTAPPAPPPPPPGPREIRFNIPEGGPQGIRRVQTQQNERVVLLIRSALADHAHLHGYDLLADVGPGVTARIGFRASVPGRFEIELEDRGQPFAELTVTP